MLIKVLAPGYYSRQDTKTPVRYGIIAMVSNMVFNLIFVFPFGYVGLAIATSLSALLNACLLYRGLHRAGVYQVPKQTFVFMGKTITAAVLMMSVLYNLMPSMDDWLNFTFVKRATELALLIGSGAVVYLLVMLLLGIRPWRMKAGF